MMSEDDRALKDLQRIGPSPELVIGLYGLPRASKQAVESLRNIVPTGTNFKIFAHSWFRTEPRPHSWHNIPEPVGGKWVEAIGLYSSLFADEFMSMRVDRQYDYVVDSGFAKYSNLLNLIYSISEVSFEIDRVCRAAGWEPKHLIITRQDLIFSPDIVREDMFLKSTVCHGGHYIGGQLNAEDLMFLTSFENLKIFCEFYAWARKNVRKFEYNYGVQYFKECGLETLLHPELHYGVGMVIDRSYANSG